MWLDALRKLAFDRFAGIERTPTFQLGQLASLSCVCCLGAPWFIFYRAAVVLVMLWLVERASRIRSGVGMPVIMPMARASVIVSLVISWTWNLFGVARRAEDVGLASSLKISSSLRIRSRRLFVGRSRIKTPSPK